MGEGHATKLILVLCRCGGACVWNVLRQGQRCLQLHNAFSQEGQSIVESAAPLVETLMCHCQPLGLIGEKFVAAIAEQADVESVEQLRVCIDVEGRALGVKVQTERGFCRRGSVGPSGLFLLTGLLRGRGRKGAGWDDSRNWASGKFGCSAGGPGRSRRKIQSHGVGGLRVNSELIERKAKNSAWAV
ncbi:hypothetical protein N7537_006061 [Penicillium hordei]|uniref:Uncharacterized protein n=1 Tax=Penicillium hordei TaxID=40994 RepID=A0AAD6E6S8_9EURO|nr:uncharacterized protein N7537_006061 [Penicillium hordei]KAJ5603105.1 hypothetical protein N7537_006061 [Penicillium hordei]